VGLNFLPEILRPSVRPQKVSTISMKSGMWIKKKGKKVGFLYSAAYAMTGPAHFTISEVAVDLQEPMVLQRKLWPSNCTR